MAKNKHTGQGGFVFSTNPDFSFGDNEAPETALPADRQVLRIWLERMKGGREATVVKGFVGPDADLEALAKQLKNKCATGGNAKEGIVIIQGDHRDKVLAFLLEQGYKNTKKAGG
jgi:translation initiation factor 1